MVILYAFGLFFLIAGSFGYFYTKDQKRGIPVILNIVNIDSTGIKDNEGIITYPANNIDVEFELNGEKISKRIVAEQVYSVGEKIKALYYPKNDSFNFNKESKSNIYVLVVIFTIALIMLTIAVLGTFNILPTAVLEEKIFLVFKYIFSFLFAICGIISIQKYLKIKNNPQVKAEIIDIKKAWGSRDTSYMDHSQIVYHYLYKYFYNGEKTYLSNLDIRFPRKKVGDHVMLIVDGEDVYEKGLKGYFVIIGIILVFISFIFLFLVFKGII